MGSSDPPYMYARPQRYSATSDSIHGFNPRAVTQASKVPPKKAPPKQEGPLINFNRHPDSYLIMPYGQTDVKPMSPNTKGKVKWTRWVQLGFRVLQLIGAIGMFICVICIKGTQDTEGWILRIPAVVDILSTLYAVYHLVRPARGRTAASSASYHFFALFVDTGLIPFYVFTAMIANTNWQEQPGTDGRWRSFFSSDAATTTILLTTWLTAITTGGMHLVSTGLDLYLILIFRNISRLPPDLNPLEDNLTSRRKTKHKAKTSSLSSITASEKRFSDITGSAVNLSSPSRLSQAQDPLIPEIHTMPFFHTRTDSKESFSPHNPRSARDSRTNLPDQIYQQSYSNRSSRADVHRRDGNMSPTKSDYKNPAVLTTTTSLPAYDSMSPSSSPSHSPTRSTKSPKRESIKNDNWFVHPAAEESYQPLPRYSFEADDDGARQPLQSYTDADIDAADDEATATSAAVTREIDAYLRPQPLRMNPPTPTHGRTPPPPMPFQSSVGSINSDHSSNIGRALTTASTATRSTTVADWTTATRQSHHHRPSSPPTSTSPKRRFYGDLREAQHGIAGRSGGGGGGGGGGTQKQLGRSPERPGYERVESSPRVVSRSGVDVDTNGDLGMERLGRRDVSGKAAEEGLAGPGRRWGLSQRKVSGVVP